MANIDFITDGEIKALNKRHITAETCKKWDYKIAQYKGKPVQVANYKDMQGQVVAQKIRFPNKDFIFTGDTKAAGLFGQHLWRDSGKMVVVTEGEIDALSVSQAFGNKWPVVSVPNGAQGAKRAVGKALEWLNKFDKVVFCFDNDEPGRNAAKECAALLPPDKAKIATLPVKDANEMTQQGRVDELIDALYGAKAYRPDGILNGADLWDIVTEDSAKKCFDYPYIGLNAKTQGLRKGEIVTVTAGSGIGKSQICREFAHYLLQQGETIGYIALEESVQRTALGLMSIAINKPLHLDKAKATPEETKEAFEQTLGTGRVYLYDHWGSTDCDNLLDKIRYLANGCGCGWIVLDHISIVVSGLDGGDERRLIDNTMTKLRALTEELQVGMILVSHLKRPSGDKGHEDGAQTSLAQLRGSAAIGQLSDIVLGCERNQQDPEQGHLTVVRVLKNRWTGETGVATLLEYHKETGRMAELPIVQATAGGEDFDFEDEEDLEEVF
jgi:twinkle protein